MEQETVPDETKEQPAPVERLAYTTAEAAKAASVNPATIYRAIARGKLRASKHIRHKRILRSELERWLLGEPIVKGVPRIAMK
jgi:excisionase family DNA binding protein